MLAAVAKQPRGLETGAEQLGNAERLVPARRPVVQVWQLHRRRCQAQGDAAKSSWAFMLPGQEFLEVFVHLALACFDPLDPPLRRVTWLGKQVALGQHEVNRKAADIGAQAAAMFEKLQEAAE